MFAVRYFCLHSRERFEHFELSLFNLKLSKLRLCHFLVYLSTLESCMNAGELRGLLRGDEIGGRKSFFFLFFRVNNPRNRKLSYEKILSQ